MIWVRFFSTTPNARPVGVDGPSNMPTVLTARVRSFGLALEFDSATCGLLSREFECESVRSVLFAQVDFGDLARGGQGHNVDENDRFGSLVFGHAVATECE